MFTDYLIADFSEGTRQDREPWILPNEAFSDLENVFMRRGIIHKRYGYSVFGQVGTLVSSEAIDTGDGGKTYSGTTAQQPVIAGSFSTSDALTQEDFTDNGDGTLTGSAGGTGTIVYSTGAWTLTYNANLAGATAITADYHYSDTGADRNIRGIFNLENTAQSDLCVACDRDNAALFDNTYEYFKNIPLKTAGTYAYFGNKAALMWGTGYKQKLFMVDGIGADASGIWVFDPSLGTYGQIYQQQFVAAGNDVAAAAAGTGDGVTTVFTQASAGSAAMITPVQAGTFTLTDGVETFTDDGLGVLTGSAGGAGTINYATGAYSVTFNAAPAGAPAPAALTKTYTAITNRVDYAQIVIPYYQRLVLLKTKETTDAGASYTTNYQRARWCKIDDPTKWRADIGGQGSSIDAATNEVILSAALIKGSLVVAFEKSIWTLDYTGNKSIPFRWRKLAGNIEINTVFGRVVTEDLVVFMGHGGIYGCDGTRVERLDAKIPDFTDEDINLTYMDQCHGAYDKKLDQALLTYTAVENSATVNDKTLVFSPKDGWFSKYDWGMHCLGNFVQIDSRTWADLIAIGATWEGAGVSGKTWKELYYQSKEDIVLGGSSKGYVYLVNDQSRGVDEPEGTETNYNFRIKSKRFTPYVQEGQKVCLGYIDILVTKTSAAEATIRLYSGEEPGLYLSKKFKMQSDRDDNKIWKRINVKHDANNHAFELVLEGDQPGDSEIGSSGFKIHAFNLGMRPSGRVRLS